MLLGNISVQMPKIPKICEHCNNDINFKRGMCVISIETRLLLNLCCTKPCDVLLLWLQVMDQKCALAYYAIVKAFSRVENKYGQH